jgi:hypothetical protein
MRRGFPLAFQPRREREGVSGRRRETTKSMPRAAHSGRNIGAAVAVER